MEASKKRSGDSVKSSPKKQKTGKKGTPSKSKKDSNLPKRPASAYLRFMEDFRKQNAKNGGSTKIGDVAKLGGNQWKAMSEKEKQRYHDEYNKAKAEYDEKMKLVKPAKDENKPKRPKSDFLFFMDAFRAEIKEKEGLTGPDAAKKGGEKWKCMTESDKEPYCKLHLAAKAKYEEDMKAYLAKNPTPPPQKKAKKSKAKVQEESESEEEEEEEAEEEDDDEEDDDEEEEEEESD